MLPFFDPMDARVYYQQQGLPEAEVKAIHTISDAMALVIADLTAQFDPQKQHVLITHFAVTPEIDTELELTSETTSKVGGLANLTARQFDQFDYVMLGHIHTRLASPVPDKMRYSGSPVKFNVKEANPHFKGKGVDIVDITATGITREFHEIKPQTDLIALSAPWETLIDPDFYQQQPVRHDWFAITVEDFDRSQHINVRAQLEAIYGTVVELAYQDSDPHHHAASVQQDLRTMSPEQTVGTFFNAVTDHDLSSEQVAIVEQLFTTLRKER